MPEDDGSAEAAMREKLALRYNTVRPFLSLLGESNALGAAQGGKRILKAVRRLPALSRRRVMERPLLPREVDTIAAANAVLITAQGRIELAQMWGGGLLASVDGLRFVVPVKSINTGPSPKYYGYKRSLTWLNAVNDQVAGVGAMVVRGTPRDSLFTLDRLLNLDGGVRPEMVATDNASYSDMAFGLYTMLGFRFAPRFRDLADQRSWRAGRDGAGGRRASRGLRALGGHRPQPGEPEADRDALAGHAARGRLADHQPGAGL